MKYLLLVFLFLAAAAPGASSDPLYPAALTLEPGYASGPPQGFPWLVDPGYGDPMVIVGSVASVGPPFSSLLPASPYEITYVFEGSACTQFGYWDDFVCGVGGIFGTFEGGTVTFYLDGTPDANFLDPSTFRDGEVVLLAASSALYASDNDPQPPCSNEPDLIAYFSFVGGTWFPQVSSDGDGFEATDRGELDDDVSPALQFLGYIFRVDGVIDIDGPVPVETTTWGGVKALYR